MAPIVSSPRECHWSLVRFLPRQSKKKMAVVTVFRLPRAMNEMGDSCSSARNTMLLINM